MLGALPSITDPVTIDGYTQGTISTPADTSDDATPNTNALAAGLNTRLLIELTDDAIGTPAMAWISEPGSLNSRIRGLSIFGFSSGAGINVVSVEGVNIEGNFLGVRADGNSAVANFYGVSMSDRTSHYDRWADPCHQQPDFRKRAGWDIYYGDYYDS